MEYTIPYPSDDELKQFYGDYLDVRANIETATINARQNLESLRVFGLNEESYVLDFGCGKGVFVEICGDRCYGIDLYAEGKGSRIFNDIEALPVEQYNFITLWGVLEHLSDPLGVIGQLTKRLLPKGYVVMTTVNAEGSIPYYYKPPEHLTYWTEKSLRYLLERNGMEIKVLQMYEMCQISKIYVERVLSRTPEKYRASILSCCQNLPKTVTVPTNEVFIVAQLGNHESSI